MTIRHPARARSRCAPLVTLFAALTGCNGSGLGDGTDAGTKDAAVSAPKDGAPGGPADLAPALSLPDLAGLSTIQLNIGPIPLAPGEERTVCTVFPLPNQAPIDVVAIDSQLKPGSHHLIFYKSNLTTAQTTPTDCQPLDIGFGQAMPKNIPLYIAETQGNNALPLPSGTAYHIDAGQMVKLEAHYINASATPLMGQGTVELTVGTPSNTYQAADIMFCGSVSQLYVTGVPPGMSSLTPGFYKPPAGVKVFGLTAHQHMRGKDMVLAKSTGQQDPGQLLLDGQPYDNEPFLRFDDQHLLTFGPTEGLRWQCNYNNPDNQTIKFGESATQNEMCFFWAYYYPSAGHFISQECLR